MKIAYALFALALVAPVNAFSAGIQVERDAQLSEGVTRDFAITLAKLIVVNGYSCNSVSAVTPFAFSRGFHVFCNGWQHGYEIEDKGGNLIVTVK